MYVYVLPLRVNVTFSTNSGLMTEAIMKPSFAVATPILNRDRVSVCELSIRAAKSGSTLAPDSWLFFWVVPIDHVPKKAAEVQM
jgi:hypothetical protein